MLHGVVVGFAECVQSETLEFSEECDILVSSSRLSDPSCNWTSAHFGITCDGKEERKIFDQVKGQNDEKKVK